MAEKSSEEFIEDSREELLGFLREMHTFKQIGNPIEILTMLSGFSVRARYMSSVAATSTNRKVKDFRFEEVLPFIQEAEFQRQIWSRIGTLVKDEWEMAKG